LLLRFFIYNVIRSINIFHLVVFLSILVVVVEFRNVFLVDFVVVDG